MVLALLILIVGGIASYTYPTYLHDHLGLSTTGRVYLTIGMGFGTAVFTTVPAFFGYVLDLLVQIELNTREAAYNVYKGHTPSPPKRHI
jgi:hypothetical protein